MVSKFPVVVAASSPVVSPAGTVLPEPEKYTIPPTGHPQLQHQALEDIEPKEVIMGDIYGGENDKSYKACKRQHQHQRQVLIETEEDLDAEIYLALLNKALGAIRKRNQHMRGALNKARATNAHLRVIKKHQQARTPM